MVIHKEGYRWDIQGLRAFAVFAVVLFHIAPNRLPGGYLGVDIFFVISGYLIIGFICRDIAAEKFNLTHFYARRIKRLFPALLATVLATTIFGYFLLMPVETIAFVKSVMSTLLYISNMFFYTQADYFAADLNITPLLHTWSLSVEEQFYIVFPVLLIFLMKFRLAILQLSLIVIGVFSFFLSEYLLHLDPSLSFFISPTRFWQFIVGGLLAMNIHKIRVTSLSSNVIGFVGLTILLICLVAYNGETLFPGFNALLPTAATLCVLLAGSTSSLFTKTMGLPINRFFGNISYSLYLWHWPVIVFYKLSQNNNWGNFSNNIIMLVVSIIMGYLSWKFIELRYSRKSPSSDSNYIFRVAFGISATIIAAMLYATNGLSHRFNEKQLYYSSFMDYERKGFRRGTCFLRGTDEDLSFYNKQECIHFEKEKYNILLIGDSHAAHWNSAITALLKKDETLTQLTSSGCRPALPLEGVKGCVEIMSYGFNELIPSVKFDQIIIAGRWLNEEFDKLQETVRYLSEYSDNVIVIGRTLEYKQDLPRLLAVVGVGDIQKGRDYDYSFFKDMDNKFKAVTLNNSKVSYVSLIDILCKPEEDVQCQTVTAEDVPVVFDYGHFTHEGALEVAKQWKINKH